MPRGPKYPLEPLAKLRDERVEAGTHELARAIGDREAAERAHRAAEAAKARAEAEAQRARDEEAERLARGEATAADLARQGAWEIAARAEAGANQQRVERAALATQRAHETEEQARAQLASRKADADAVHQDHARWKAREEKRVLSREEELAEEAWRKK